MSSTILSFEELLDLSIEELQAYAVENLISFTVFERANSSNLAPGDPVPPAEALIFLDAVEETFGIDTSELTLAGDEAFVTDDAFFSFLDEFIVAVESTGFDLDGFLSSGNFSAEAGFVNPGPDVAPLDTFATIDAVSLIDELINFGFTFIPPDPHAAAGKENLINVTNTVVEIFQKDGTQLDQFALSDLFDSPTETFDPKVVYDHFNDRFVIITLEQTGVTDGIPNPDDTSVIYAAVSKDGNPTSVDDFDTIAIDALSLGFTTAGALELLWADFPGLSVSEDAIYITSNRFVVDGPGFATPGLWIIEKGEGEGGFYDGGAPNVLFTDPVIESGFPPSLASTIQPSLNFGDLPEGVDNYLYAAGFTFGGGVPGAPEAAIIYEVTDPFAEGGPTFTANITVLPDFDLFAALLPDAPQPDPTAVGIEVNDRRSLDVVYRDGLLYSTFTGLPVAGPNAGQTTAYYSVVDVTDFSLVELVEIGGEDISEGAFTFFPSIAVNSAGDIVVTFSAAGPDLFAGAYATGRQAGDAFGLLRPSIVVAEGEDVYELIDGSGRNRWGDYTGAVVDPMDDSFWVYNLNAEVFPGFIPVWDTAYANIQFGSGNDNLFGDDADDVLIGGEGNDSLFGRRGNDLLDGGDGDDQIHAEDGDDVATGGAGRDNIFAGQGDDMAFGGDGDDQIFGNQGNDTLVGGDGNDQIFGHGDDDFIFGEEGDDRLFGDGGNDSIDGGIGNDTIFAGGGDDTVIGGEGDDEIFGGGGDNLFVYEDGFDSVRDFNRQRDALDISATGIGSLEELEGFATKIGGQLAFIFDEAEGDILQVFNTQFSQLTDDNFFFFEGV